MTKQKKTKWQCPECGKGALGSSRPRMDDIVRYCLACSKRQGKLVRRTAPALDAKRRAVAERQQAKQQRVNAKRTLHGAA